MLYISTRGQAEPAGFTDVLLSGLAPDGGLYVPETWPEIPADEIAGFAGRPYAEVAAAVLSRFTGPAIEPEALQAICTEAYATFSHPAVTPLNELEPGLWMQALHHGPTLAFKDVAMQLLARLYEHVLTGSGANRRLTVVTATSGDTGGAAVEALRGRAGVNLVVLYPEGRISEVQRRFMTTTNDANVRCVAVAGDFDDCQAILKGLFADEGFRTSVDLSGVNSINIGRIAAQCVYYFTAAVALGAPARSVSFAVPTGNFGDAFAGWVAKRMGLPIERIVVATNGNDILARALQGGRYERGVARATQSPAMDIQVASNFERLYFEAVGREPKETARAFRAFAATGAIELPPSAAAFMRETFSGDAVDEDETERTMRSTLGETGELIDPHTAVGLAAARRAERTTAPLVVLSTAHPAKFPDAVRAATGVEPDMPAQAAGLFDRPERIDRLPAEAQAVKLYVREFAQT
jgi:threonine synthase